MRSERSILRLRRVKTVLWFLVGLAAVVGLVRFVMGLGPSTALTDRTPWGFWIGFDILGGVALAAGGFVIAAVVYVFRLERYRSLLRPAVLTAFLGYGAVVLGLLFDIGRPWNLWRPMFYWQHHSALFEVAWCVMLYFTVLALEFGPVPLEGSRFRRVHDILKKAALPLVILGIMLSTLHQSSLGTLFLIMPGRVHPLWYSEVLPLLFFVSAVALGLAMVTVESLVSSWLFDREPETPVLRGLARGLIAVLAVLFLVRTGDLLARGRMAHLLDGDGESALFVGEMLLSILVPIGLLLLPRVRRSVKGLATAAGMVVFGIVLNRMNVGGVSGIGETGSRYLPSWQEISISAGVVSVAALVFLFFVERFSVYEPEPEGDPEPSSARPNLLRRLSPLLGNVRVYTFAFVIGASLALAALPDRALGDVTTVETPVAGPRRAEAIRRPWAEPDRPGFALLHLDSRREAAAGADVRRVLLLDADRNGRYVLFDHAGHAARLGGDTGCGQCHHMRRPLDLQTSCFECHRDMHRPTDLFDHDGHADALGGNAGCSECHPRAGEPKTRETATSCRDCHPDLWEPATRIPERTGSWGAAPGYQDAIHGLCLTCHEQEDEKAGVTVPALGRCGTCHVETKDLTPRRVRGGAAGDRGQTAHHRD